MMLRAAVAAACCYILSQHMGICLHGYLRVWRSQKTHNHNEVESAFYDFCSPGVGFRENEQHIDISIPFSFSCI